MADSLEAVLSTWSEFYFAEEYRETAVAHWMHKVTGSDEWGERFGELFHQREQ
jgi:hypothetical protein